MPGGRLNRRDRRQIALGLADDLPYAEIARRLERPTSTVTREVMRNGGPTAYRADLAHRATEQRARHRRGVTARNAQVPAQAHGRDAEEVRAYEETFTAAMTQSGMPRMPARVLTALSLTDTGSLTASELVGRLGVSPASVSKAVAFLESQGMVRREREARRERYLVDGDLMYEAMMASARSLSRIVHTAREGADVLGHHTPAGVRLENIARFLDVVSQSTARAAEEARAILHEPPGPSV